MKTQLITVLLIVTTALPIHVQDETKEPAERASWQLFEPKGLPAGKRLPLHEATKLTHGAHASQRFYSSATLWL